MAIRQTTLVIKNNTVPNAPFSGATLLKGEPIVNTADGILMFSGVTSSTSEWTPAGTGGDSSFFEVGSNLYDLKIRNQITAYSGVTNLTGKFLSGTTTGFVLADISDIANAVDSYTTGATWNPNILTLELNNGKPNVSVTIDTFTALTVDSLTVTGTTDLSGTSSYYATVNGTNPNEIVNVDYLTGFSQTNDVYVTGSTYSGSSDNINVTTFDLSYHGTPIGGAYSLSGEDTYTTGGTYFTGGTLVLDRNDGNNYQITGLTADLNAEIAALAEADELTIELDIATNKIRIKDIVSAPSGGTRVFLGNTEIGTGGSYDTPGTGSLIVHGDLTVFGSATTVSTNELYIEDPQITLNYNPTGSTTFTSVSSGLRIQDGNGITSGDTYFTVGLMQNLVSGSTSEYTGLTGYNNRGWVTQLNDIVIRNTNLDSSAPDGVRVLGEGDILDGGQY